MAINAFGKNLLPYRQILSVNYIPHLGKVSTSWTVNRNLPKLLPLVKMVTKHETVSIQFYIQTIYLCLGQVTAAGTNVGLVPSLMSKLRPGQPLRQGKSTAGTTLL